ncbi:MAG: 3-hydroxyacyl-ACP dehydratase FabZ [Candidatus Omnitrophica bacterium]|nr:3-hydroxyacyl-ACP dehydratase FabZ [Candidatus Omnitrophota bacterium]
MHWDKEKIKSILPQREPFLFIDEVIEVEEGKRVVAKKYLDPALDFFKGHFPGNPVMPGALIIEAMAQTGLILYYTTKPHIAKTHPDYYLTSINVTFKSPVYPKDTLILEAHNFKIVEFGGVVDITAKVKDKIVATSRSTFAVVTKKNQDAK